MLINSRARFAVWKLARASPRSFPEWPRLPASRSLLRERRVGDTRSPQPAPRALRPHMMAPARARGCPRGSQPARSAERHRCSPPVSRLRRQAPLVLYCIYFIFFICPDVRQPLRLSPLCRVVVFGCRHRPHGSRRSRGVEAFLRAGV